MLNNKEIAQNKENESSLILPVNGENLAKFISSLLGQPHRIEREFKGTFVITKEWLLDMHTLIIDTIKTQNKATFIEFSAIIYFEDGMSRELKSIESFVAFRELQMVCSTSVRMEWTLLINFPEKTIPEKQTIILYVITPDGEEDYNFLLRMFDNNYEESKILLSIDTTERSWADTTDAFLSNLIKQKVKKIKSHQKLIRGLIRVISYLLIIISFLFPIRITEIIGAKMARDNYVYFFQSNRSEGITLEDLAKRIDIYFYWKTMDADFDGNEFGIATYYIVSIALIWLTSFAMAYLASKSPRGYLLLSEKSEEEYNKITHKEKHKKIFAIVSFIFGILASVIGNYIYYYISTH